MTPRPPILCSRRGFTLIEVMLALAIFALIGSILYGAFSLGHGAVSKTQASFEASQKLRSLTDLLGGYIRSSHPYRVSSRDPTIFYAGEETRLVFISSVSLAMGGRGMAKIELNWEETGAREGILRLVEEAPVRLDGEDEAGGARSGIVLGERVKDFRLEYLDPQSEPDLWEKNWDGKERRSLPRAVRLNYRDEGGREVRLVFPVMMSVLAP